MFLCSQFTWGIHNTVDFIATAIVLILSLVFLIVSEFVFIFSDIDSTLSLLARVVAGDIIYVISVNRFPSVSRFLAFADAVLQEGVSLRILEQPYLEVGNGKHFRPAVVENLRVLVYLERSNAQRLISTFSFNASGKDYAADCIADITVGILAKTYSSDGILHRGG